jgi:hypothetical protein
MCLRIKPRASSNVFIFKALMFAKWIIYQDDRSVLEVDGYVETREDAK